MGGVGEVMGGEEAYGRAESRWRGAEVNELRPVAKSRPPEPRRRAIRAVEEEVGADAVKMRGRVVREAAWD